MTKAAVFQKNRLCIGPMRQKVDDIGQNWFLVPVFSEIWELYFTTNFTSFLYQDPGLTEVKISE